MASRYSVRLEDLTISNGNTESNVLDEDALSGAETLAIYAPDTLDAATFTVQVAPVPEPAAADWTDLQIDGADVTLTADKATIIFTVPFRALRISSSVAVAADRVFAVVTREQVH